ncbi:putative secreted protein [Streptomyces sp. Tu6071]|uniref:alpha/beta hydrolase n=1 Tax=unclassified Streptomyces TaxID=2593676 RepID=UPI00020E5FE0|nr:MULTISPECIES: alpha/beta fold hydrolase [unclassified Streptomyces]ASY35601.1 alpha/beta hydrolase [Streptomyces sp. CLI2509]EGJ78308.1 putative secreted protein [Streptomyces sp. Tu6071]
MRTVKTTAQATAAALTALLGAGAAAVAAGRLAGEAGLRPRPGRPLPTEPKLTVHTATADRVTLTRALASLRPGVYGLAGEDGRHASVGRVLEAEAHKADTVVRELLDGAGEFKPGAHAQLTPQVYTGTPRTALGLDYEDVEIAGLPGALPAWFVPAARATWVIAAHGLGTTREHALVLMDFLHRQQFPVLALAYRGDPGAPAAEGGLSRFGADEWQDLEAAVRWAVRHGARRVVLLGWSTGASMALRVAARSEHRDRIAGLVLDSPVLSWQYALEGLARARRTPGFVLPLAVRAAEGRAGLPKERVDRAADPQALRVPVFLAQSEDDALAPYPLARAFARSRPDLIVTHTVDKAPHSAAWNRDPTTYEEALRRFLTPLM